MKQVQLNGWVERWALPAASALALAGMLVLTAGCRRGEEAKPAPKPPAVDVSLPVADTITDYEDFTGQLQAVSTVNLQARVTGYLKQANFKEGMAVSKGDVLFEIDPLPYQAEKQKADAALQKAKAKLERLTTNYKRALALLNKGVMSQEDFDLAKGEFLEAGASLKSVDADVDIAVLNLGYCTVTAPLAGRVGRILVDPGNLIKADTTILTSIVSQDPIYAYFNLDERTLLKIKRLVQEGVVSSPEEAVKTVKMGLSDDEGFPHDGKLDFMDNKLDPGTGTLQVRAVFDNPKKLLLPGLFARFRLPIGGQRSALLVAERALGTDQGQKYVYVLDDKDEVVYRKVKVGSQHNGLRVIEKGLTAKDRVLVTGLQKVRPGTKVQAKLVPMPSLTPSEAPAVNLSPKLSASNP